jgi:hypothetical protein
LLVFFGNCYGKSAIALAMPPLVAIARNLAIANKQLPIEHLLPGKKLEKILKKTANLNKKLSKCQ